MRVRIHPDGGLFVGDQVSFEVIAPVDVNMDGRQAQLEIGDDIQAQADFAGYGIAGRNQATFLWVWDTTEEKAGERQVTVSIVPGGPTWTETVTLYPQSQLPFPGADASWASAESDCCLVHYITGTAVERDLESLLASLDRQADVANQLLQVELTEPIDVTFIPRVLGHGGFASDGVSVSYLDRNYAGSNSDIVFQHEMVHILDSRLAGELRPTALVEGLAVYLSGGHFKREPLFPRVAALLPAEPGCIPGETASQPGLNGQEACGLDWYLPLTQLVDNFYYSQHEIGYLQAGALVEYMVERWGWPAYSAFYRDIQNQPAPAEDLQEIGGPQYQAMDVALVKHFDLTMDQLEFDFVQALRQERVSAAMVEDVRLTVRYYDTIRRYQELMDPAAYFLTAWLPDSKQMRERHIVADYLRQPATDENMALEAMLVSTNQYLLEAQYAQAERYLDIIAAVLDQIAQKQAQPFAVHPIAQDYLSLVIAARQAGYIPQRIYVGSIDARVWANDMDYDLVELQFNRQMQGWGFASGVGMSDRSITGN